jgi:hypothetical protein
MHQHSIKKGTQQQAKLIELVAWSALTAASHKPRTYTGYAAVELAAACTLDCQPSSSFWVP